MTPRHLITFCLMALCATGCKSAPEPTPDTSPATSEEVSSTSSAETQDDAPKKVNATNTGRIKLFNGEAEEPAPTDESGEQPSLRISYGGDEEQDGGADSASESTESPEELYQRASKKVMEGDSQGAITDCEAALAGGQEGCHQVMGLAYKQLGDTQNACSSFNKALLTGPKNAEGIATQMEELECP